VSYKCSLDIFIIFQEENVNIRSRFRTRIVLKLIPAKNPTACELAALKQGKLFNEFLTFIR